MKLCPTCRRTYDDDGLNFCLEDGSVLTFAPLDPGAPTVVMKHARPTSPAPPAGQIRTGWDPQDAAAYSMQPKKKSSKTWLWVVAIFGVLILVCGGGFVGFFVYVASVANVNENSNSTRVTNSSTTTKTNTTTTKSPGASPDDTGSVQRVDFAKLIRPKTSSDGTTDVVDGELIMASREKGYYYVLVTPDDFKTDKARTRVTVRNTDDADSDLGYGLVFHSHTRPLESGYAFLIDSKRKRYRVVRHEPQDEITVTAWTSSALINGGEAENTLEVRDKGPTIDLFINGQLATTITNKQGPKGGVPGMYSGDGVKIGFSNLEIEKYSPGL